MHSDYEFIKNYKETFSHMKAPEELKNRVKNLKEKQSPYWSVRKIGGTIAAGILILCICFHSQIYAAAEEFFYKYAIWLGNDEIDAKLGIVTVNEMDDTSWNTSYYNLEDVEELLGITLLKSDKTYNSPIPCVQINNAPFEEKITIYNRAYFLNNVVIDLFQDKEGHVFEKKGSNAYIITYSASFFTAHSNENVYIDEFPGAELIEKYTTANNLSALIYKYAGNYYAHIYHENIRYEIELRPWDRTEDENTLKAYLDTLE